MVFAGNFYYSSSKSTSCVLIMTEHPSRITSASQLTAIYNVGYMFLVEDFIFAVSLSHFLGVY